MNLGIDKKKKLGTTENINLSREKTFIKIFSKRVEK